MKDKCGTEVCVGQIVDILYEGMLSAHVIEVNEGGLVGGDGRIQPAVILLSVAIPVRLDPGDVAPLYVVRQALAKKAEAEESETEKPGPRRIM